VRACGIFRSAGDVYPGNAGKEDIPVILPGKEILLRAF
jgi:hypothetical protein